VILVQMPLEHPDDEAELVVSALLGGGEVADCAADEACQADEPSAIRSVFAESFSRFASNCAC
jgi:hypothetical protein